jgi:hypothetical protein
VSGTETNGFVSLTVSAEEDDSCCLTSIVSLSDDWDFTAGGAAWVLGSDETGELIGTACDATFTVASTDTSAEDFTVLSTAFVSAESEVDEPFKGVSASLSE